MGVGFWVVIFTPWIDKRLYIGLKFWDAMFGFPASHLFGFDGELDRLDRPGGLGFWREVEHQYAAAVG